jgi:hypothetical protein
MGIRDESLEAKKDLPVIRDLAQVWRQTREPAMLVKLSVLLDAWATVYQPSYNPIDETDFDMVIDAYAITGAALPEATRTKVSVLVRNWATGYVQQMQAMAKTDKEGTWTNNWQSHRIKLATMAAVAMDDGALFDGARRAFKRQLNKNLTADGASIDFTQRDALHYTVYDLEPLVRAAMAARLRGEDWLTMRADSGTSLGAALDWLLPFASGAKVHEEYVHTTVKFDLQRRDAGVAGFSGQWEPRSSALLYWTASILDGRYLAVAQSLAPQPPWLAACWTMPTFAH